MRGLPADGTWRNFRAHGAGAACLRRFEMVERRGMEAQAGGAGRWRRWNGADPPSPSYGAAKGGTGLNWRSEGRRSGD